MAAKEALRDLLEQLESFVTTKTVVGEAIHINDTIILPLVDVSFGAAAGSGDKQLDKKGNDFVGGGLGAKMSPSAVIVIKDGQTRLVNVKNQDTVDEGARHGSGCNRPFYGRQPEERGPGDSGYGEDADGRIKQPKTKQKEKIGIRQTVFRFFLYKNSNRKRRKCGKHLDFSLFMC